MLEMQHPAPQNLNRRPWEHDEIRNVLREVKQLLEG